MSETRGTCDVCGRQDVALKPAPHHLATFVCVDSFACAEAWDRPHQIRATTPPPNLSTTEGEQ